ncbi:hypothetical protein E8E12_000562 [Didymella heteroderae]|uniref:Uncharacterized protein n=1 Tax=Didymella heteroderae TaxID=1769908 RepID=A0A9P4WH40_9PLEO|nr:hypothetical protein E8E12_000562 [Didymella heteroderae]
MPSPICPASKQGQVSLLDCPSSQIASSGTHSPTPLSASIVQANDPGALAESLTAIGQSLPPEDEPGLSSMPITESVIRSNDSPASCTRQTFTSVESPASPRPSQQSPKPKISSDVSPAPEVSHTPSEENDTAATQPLLPTPVSEAHSSENVIAGSAWLWRGGAAAELCGYQPSSTDETSKAESSTSRQPTPFNGEQPRKSQTRSPPLITDTNRGIPIVIYDTDEEINEVANEEIKKDIEEAKTEVAALHEASRLREPKESRKRSLRKRVRG